jgi:trans-aconitate methyltransferase
MEPKPFSRASFDAYAVNYDEALNQGLSVSGEDKQFFARGRIAWLARCLQALHFCPQVALDFGCGTGTSVPLLFELLKVQSVIGIDISAQSIAVADRQFGSAQTQFCLLDDYQACGDVDVVFCNGVFHHIPPEQRPAALRYVLAALRPGGWFALWENNPLNPGTRYVMSKIPFDRDAITVTGGAARALLEAEGFQVWRTDYLFIFPKMLRIFRSLEPCLSRLPLGAQYQVLGQKVERNNLGQGRLPC